MGCGPSKGSVDQVKQEKNEPTKTVDGVAKDGKKEPPSVQDLLALIPVEAGEVSKESQVVFVLGGPGSGKGTQCDLIVKKYGFKHLSAGDLLRDEVKSGSEVGKACEAIMKEGQLVPTEVTVALLKNAMIRTKATQFLIDGFPRAMDQALNFEKEILPCDRVLFFDCPESVMEERLLKRGQTSGRSDDNAETIKKRFHTFINQSVPVVDHYRQQRKLSEISAVPSPEEVFSHVQHAMELVLEDKQTKSQQESGFSRGDLSTQAEPVFAAA